MTDSDEEQLTQAEREAALFGPAGKADHKTGDVIKFSSVDTGRKVLTGKIIYIRAPAPAIQGGRVHPTVYLCYVEGEHIPCAVYPADVVEPGEENEVYEIVVDNFSPRHRRWLVWMRRMVWMRAACPHPHHPPRTCKLPQGSEVSPGLTLENSCAIYNYFIHPREC